jgi:hypothetical protein
MWEASDQFVVQHDRIRDLRMSRVTEWLVTNGRGGFAMGSIGASLPRSAGRRRCRGPNRAG